MAEAQSSGSNASEKKPKSNGFIPGDDILTHFRNIYAGITGKMTPEGVQQFMLARDLRNEEADCKRCETQKEYLLNYSTEQRRFTSLSIACTDTFSNFQVRS
ncbi:metalloprotease ATP23 [Arthroderma uncinatum]|uniref:metalloprotease ATP23 n=1 Tax=Arthroderma uncinatum TaxID=74035 RepID=UPI00144A87E3|nr:metalloprotease ATP23 [Arthroderma uncinatum]KAF3491142.1 metalloprotease ATP23 [Arthroderma uncinatum]